MGTKQDSNGTYQAWAQKRHEENGVPQTMRRKGIATLAEARRIERELILIVEEKAKRPIVSAWSQVVEDCIKSKKLFEWSERTSHEALLCLKHYTYKQWQNRSINTITTAEIKQLVALETKERSDGTRQTLLKFIRAVFEFAKEAGIINHNPSPTIRFKPKNKICTVLTEPQVKIFLEKARDLNSPWYFHWVVAVYTGMRNGELFALTWDKVNFESRNILVSHSWNRYDGMKETKSGNDRMVEIALPLLQVLKELKLKSNDSIYVLPRSRDWEKGEQARAIKFFLRGIGLPEIRFHDLRATWATIMLNNGVEPIKVMYMGGWCGLKTMQLYIRKAGIDIKGITNKLNLHNPTQQVAEIIHIGSSL